MRLRRRRCLVCYWYDGSFVAHPYPGGKALTLPPAAAEILTAFENWSTREQAAASLGSPADDIMTALHDNGLLVAEGSQEADRDARIAEEWSSWEPEGPFFHYATQDTITAEMVKNAKNPPISADERPPIFTEYPDAERILLPRRPADLRAAFGEVLYRRRTSWDFTAEPVTLDVLAVLLATCFGPADFIGVEDFGVLFRRTSPAGGARQEIDAYLAIRNVSNVPPGLYHYNVREHSLELLSKGFTREDAVHLCAGQDWAGGTAFLVVLSAVLERIRFKYRAPRAYRVCLLNAGHLGQTFVLTATALGLGPWQTEAFHDSAVTERLGLDNTSRTPLYVLGAGHPEPEPKSAPSPAGPVRLPR